LPHQRLRLLLDVTIPWLRDVMPWFAQCVLLFFLETISGTLDRPHEAGGKAQPGAAPAITNHDPARDITPVDDL